MPVTGDFHEKVYEIERVAPHAKQGYLLEKRVFDICFSLILLLIVAIPMLILIVLIKCDSKGPAVFCQERLGENGKPFMIYKFRTMRLDAEADGPRWASENDSRCTRVGATLRKYHLDEMPQFWNILRGDMSFVGPRPEREFFYNEFEGYIHGYCNRLVVRPGLTGWAQVNGGYDLAPEEKIIYDMQYIQKQSRWMDVRCLVKTIAIVVKHNGAY